MLLGVETGIGIVGLGALNALRLFTANIAPKRVRVVTDIDDTVKSSGNKRFLGVPLGGIDAQCKIVNGFRYRPVTANMLFCLSSMPSFCRKCPDSG